MNNQPKIVRVPQLPGRVILQQHIDILHETIEVHHAGMTPAAIAGINQEIKNIKRIMEAQK